VDNSSLTEYWSHDDAVFGRVLAAYGGVFIAGSLAWGVMLDGLRPDRWDLIGTAVCLAGVAVIMFAPSTRDDKTARPGPWWARRTGGLVLEQKRLRRTYDAGPVPAPTPSASGAAVAAGAPVPAGTASVPPLR
jgi:hypothetical protein